MTKCNTRRIIKVMTVLLATILLACSVIACDNINAPVDTTDAPTASAVAENTDVLAVNTDAPTAVATDETSGIATNAPTSAPTNAPTLSPTAIPTVDTPNGSTVYLTFDDGPSTEVTPMILDTLKKYNVKATFFITNFSDAEIPILKRMINEGHAIGIHTYTHVYSEIYASVDAYWADFDKLVSKLEAATGYKADIMRFPGGSSNSSSKQYCVGIMTKVTQQMAGKGYQYFDWNVDSQDAVGNGKSAEELANNVVNGLSAGRKQNVVLMHDIEGKETTGQAVELIIERALALGFKFDKLTSSTPAVQHQVNN